MFDLYTALNQTADFIAEKQMNVTEATKLQILLSKRIKTLFDSAAKDTIKELRKRSVLDPATGKQVATRMKQLQSGIAEQVYEQIKKEMNMPLPATQELRQKVFQASERTMDAAIGDVTKTLAKAYEDGVGVAEAANRLKKDFNHLSNFQLKVIARTEMHGAQNVARLANMQNSTAEYKQWVAEEDPERTRPSHLYTMDGQIVRVGDLFSNDLRYPGDTNGDIDEWINCRCRMVAFVMPLGFKAPNQSWFYEEDLIEIDEKGDKEFKLEDEELVPSDPKKVNSLVKKISKDRIKVKGSDIEEKELKRKISSWLGDGSEKSLTALNKNKVNFSTEKKGSLGTNIGGHYRPATKTVSFVDYDNDILTRAIFNHETFGHGLDDALQITGKIKSGSGSRPKAGKGKAMNDLRASFRKAWKTQIKAIENTEAYKLKPAEGITGRVRSRKAGLSADAKRDLKWWKKLDPEKAFISRYACLNESEFFAEAMKDYMNGGSRLKNKFPDLYKNIKDALMQGKEFEEVLY